MILGRSEGTSIGARDLFPGSANAGSRIASSVHITGLIGWLVVLLRYRVRQSQSLSQVFVGERRIDLDRPLVARSCLLPIARPQKQSGVAHDCDRRRIGLLQHVFDEHECLSILSLLVKRLSKFGLQGATFRRLPESFPENLLGFRRASHGKQTLCEVLLQGKVVG